MDIYIVAKLLNTLFKVVAAQIQLDIRTEKYVHMAYIISSKVV